MCEYYNFKLKDGMRDQVNWRNQDLRQKDGWTWVKRWEEWIGLQLGAGSAEHEEEWVELNYGMWKYRLQIKER